MIYVSRDRNSKDNIITESPKALNFFYGNFFGRLLLRPLISKPVSNLAALYMNSRWSKRKIDKFVDKNDINIYEYDDKKYKSYNDFFTRKVIPEKRPINTTKGVLISPCDSKLTAYKINEDLTLNIKGAYYSINSLIDKDIINDYVGGYALVFRLCINNYHHYYFIDDGNIVKSNEIKGKLYTVRPISDGLNVFTKNNRIYSVLSTQNIGDLLYIEVGATMVGKIVNRNITSFKRGEEKGYFKMGGSTIVLLIQNNKIELNKNISLDKETDVKCLETIGKIKKI